jgi:hypothetical protein
MLVEGPGEILLARESCDAWLQETADSLELAVLPIADLQLPIANWFPGETPIGNRQSTIGNSRTHPLPPGGTDLMGPQLVSKKRGSPDAVRHKMPVRYTLRPLENCRNLQAGLIWPKEVRSRRK